MTETEHEQDIPLEEPAPEPEPDEEEAAEAEEAAPIDTDEEPDNAAAQPTDEERAKFAKGMTTRWNTYKTSVEKFMAEDAQHYMYCPLCSASETPGYFANGAIGRVPEEIVANVKTVLGYAREQEYEQDPDTRPCPKCKGKTKVKSGAIDGDYILRGCDTCAGYGFVPPPGTPSTARAANGTPAELVAAAIADVDLPERDNWGEPRVLPDGTVNSNFGKMPQFKTVHPTFGVTANLSPEELISG